MKKYIFISILLALGIFGTAYGASVLFPYQGGTGTGTVPSNGELLIGNSSGTYDVTTLTAGSNITITEGSGSITIASTGGGGSPGGTDGQLQYNDGGAFGGGTALIWDDANNHLGIGDITPDYKLEILDTTTQLTLTYADTSTYTEFFTDVNGDLHINPSGGDVFMPATDFSGAVTGISLSEIEDLTADKTFGMGNKTLTFNWTGASAIGLELNAIGNFTNDVLHIHQHTGNPGASNLIHAEAEDQDVSPLIHITQSDTTLTASVIGLQIDAADDDDSNWIPFQLRDDSAGTPDILFQIDYTGSVVTGIWAADFTAGSIDGDDMNANIAGRSLTLTAGSPDTLDADPELYQYVAKFAIIDPVDTDDFFFGEIGTSTVTFTSIYCKTLVGTAEIDIQIAGVDINGTDISCTTSGVLDSSLGGDTAGATGEEVKMAITSVASAPTYIMVILRGEYAD